LLLWPPNSRDLNPVDYKIWGLMQEHVYKSLINDVHELKQQLVETRTGMQQRVIHEAVEEWQKRLQLCVSAEGGQSEHTL